MLHLAATVVGMVAIATHLAHGQEAEGQVVVPRAVGAGGAIADMFPVDVSLWEYSDRDTYVTTGKGVTLRLPKAFLASSTNREGGPQFAISILYDLQNERPWFVGGAGQLISSGRSGNDARQAREVSLTLRPYGFVNSVRSLAQIETGNAIPAAAISGQVFRVPGESCGFDLFDANESWPVFNLGNGVFLDHQVSAPPPFNFARLFARPRDDGSYDSIISCQPTGTSVYPWCGTATDFEGWPMTIRFSGRHICQLDDLVNQARTFVSQYVIQRTERRPGEVENRDIFGSNSER